MLAISSKLGNLNKVFHPGLCICHVRRQGLLILRSGLAKICIGQVLGLKA